LNQKLFLQQKRDVVVTVAAGEIGSLLVQRFLSKQDRVFAMNRNAEGLKRLQSAHANSDSLNSFGTGASPAVSEIIKLLVASAPMMQATS